jgi:hypothetical protein
VGDIIVKEDPRIPTPVATAKAHLIIPTLAVMVMVMVMANGNKGNNGNNRIGDENPDDENTTGGGSGNTR